MKMKVIALLVATLSVATAFAPQVVSSRSTTALNEKFWDKVAGMDLFAPNPDINKYGQRGKKVKQGSIGSNSYVPAGLSLSEYQKIRQKDVAKRDASYKRNVAKAGKYTDFTDWYVKRGTEEGGGWLKAAGRGHTFAKLKYEDLSQQKKYDGTGNIFGKKTSGKKK
ncbi:predicted protein [Phaeodactylum tricornutum CCAP 1055/1]|jgi:hypothetical protein|uniref:Uncharacterized protein n=3 Tax=Phaeodactylum tricornutum TaxID=2850 RepID=B7FY71_PHATC|nr:predicted protein [Phaeodactylum tricornutum CCAP 1055/1]EEC48672.1 predicted protein [Phaeodactylum tricornutum CCAP 1055/1]|mmetsp:Transcript_60141/g.161346  ORF Transcript_60141/g.161346 Transcript_60141/m.161346 type:complete len:166 (+) Transcript_60141:112-609(+)|eukprot:XP_002179686.1 predicted protein [Phaeodactylum tricornutum CCAP 1055/1]